MERLTFRQRVRLLIGIKPKPKHTITPCGIQKTVVSREFLKSFPNWNENRFSNIQIID